MVVFLLTNGRFGAGWVLRVLEEGDDFSRARGHGAVTLVQLSPWIGEAPPALDEPLLKRVLLLTHHDFNREARRLWAHHDLPGDFEVIGNIRPSARHRRQECNVYGYWANLPVQRWVQWRWENDRQAVLAEDAARDQRDEARLERKRREKLTLAKLKRKKRLESWDRSRPRRVVIAARRILKTALTQCDASVKGALRDAVRAYNKLRLEPDGYIRPSEREQIIAHMVDMAWVAGWTDEAATRALIDKHRKW